MQVKRLRETGGLSCGGIIALACVAVLVAAAAPALAQGSLGIGAGETTAPPGGLFAGTMLWVNTMQQEFYRSLTGALKGMREDPAKLWFLVGLSFAYGVFHAAGPGHGKAVISSYMLANEVALRRGIALSFLSSLLQGTTAIVVIGLVFLFLRGTSVSMGDATHFLEVASFGLIAVFGAWLLWRKLYRVVLSLRAPAAITAGAGGHHHHHDHHNHGHDHDHHHHHGEGEVCDTCGHAHMPDPQLLSGDRFSWKTAWAAIAAVGIRPCSGALIVLTFAFLNQLWLGGIVSVIAMSLGTAITVSTLASLAVTAKNLATRFVGGGPLGSTIHDGIEIAGALFIMLIGLVLLSASFSG